MRRLSCAVALVALIGVSSGCYHHHLRAKGDRVNSSYFRKTLNSSSEGKRSDFIVPSPLNNPQGNAGLASSADCQGNGMYEVGITSYWKYAAGTVLSFGQWSRVKVEWLCAKQPPVIGPRGLGQQPPAPVEAAAPAVPPTSVAPKPRKIKQDDFKKRTVHAFFWGALQQNLLPPVPSAASKSPATCRSMRQVKLPVNYGFSLITVVTAGIWSPMRVAWQCNEDPIGGSNAKTPTSPGAIVPFSPHAVALRPPDLSPRPSILSSKERTRIEEKHVPR